MTSSPWKSEVNYDATPASESVPARESSQPATNGQESNKEHSKFLQTPSHKSSRYSIDSGTDVSLASERIERDGRVSHYLPVSGGQRYQSRSPAPPKTWRARLSIFWDRNRGLVLVLLSQLFGAMMNVATRLLEIEGEGMDPLQILFARMGITAVLCAVYMWYKKVPHFPFGQRDVRALLVARGLGGFFGVSGMYYSLLYLPVAEATVLTFLAPILACWACSVFINEPFTRKEQLAGLVSLFGVVLIARPVSFFSSSTSTTNTAPVASGSGDGIPAGNATKTISSHDLDSVTPTQRLMAVGIAMIGVLGAACAYTTIRWIGKRAHPLISVNYFATWCTIVSTCALLFIPSLSFKLPANLTQWFYLIFLGVCGFIMQFLLTAGLAHEKSSRATNMVYMQMLFALAFDEMVWGTRPGAWSIIGSALILGAAVYVAVIRDGGKTGGDRGQGKEGEARGDEERGLVDGIDDDDDDDDRENDGRGRTGAEAAGDEGRGPLRGVQEVQLRTLRV